MELALVRTKGDRRRYAIDRVGTLRLEGALSRKADVEAGGPHWTFQRRGIVTTAIEATDAAGTVVGDFSGRALRRGGTLRWGARELELGPASMWKERYALTDGDRELAMLDGRSWGKTPVTITIADGEQIEPGLLLFAAFVVRQLAEDGDSTSGGAASVAATSG